MKVTILGSTGSIGTQTLEVADGLYKHGVHIEVVGLSANKNINLLADQIFKYRPKVVAVMDGESAGKLIRLISKRSIRTKVLVGMDGLLELCSGDAELVVNALVGNVGLLPTIEAIKNKKNVALANKEALVTAGGLIIEEAINHNVRLLPIDSEHSAIAQCLAGSASGELKRIYLTASGGPFRLRKSLEGITPKEALDHPNWKMGAKITIDSATLMNKGLEVIEAKWLFGVEASQIKIVIHPQSVVHSMVEFQDGAVIAQLGLPDMRIPIQYALTFPQRVKNDYPPLDFFEKNMLTFEKPDTTRFKCLSLAYEALEQGGTMPAVMNAANEVAVGLFLEQKIDFIDISGIIEKTMLAYKDRIVHKYSVSNVIEADAWAREFASDKTDRH